jgi:hypothetical protein
MASTPFSFGYYLLSIRFQQTKSQVCTFVLQRRMPLPSMHFTRRRFTLADRTMARPV